MTTEDGLDLAEDTTGSVLFSAVFSSVSGSRGSRGRVAVLVGNTSRSVLSARQTSLGVRVRVSSTAGSSGVVVKVARDSVSRDTSVLVGV